jgi:hypothetical protein
VLDGLDDVTWATYDSAYGPADHVPILLRALAYGPQDAAEDAFEELIRSLYHQGVWPAMDRPCRS